MNTFNAALAQKIKQLFKKKSIAVESLSEWLFLSSDAVYRRLRGDTLFSFEEACTIAKKLNFSLDELAFSTSKGGFIQHFFYDQKTPAFRTFLKDMLQRFEEVSDLENARIFYSTKGLPIFIFLNYPKLLSFKSFVWKMASWNAPENYNTKFSFDLLEQTDLTLIHSLNQHYQNLPSSEIWNNAILNSILEQIRYVNALHLFKNQAVVIELFDLLEEILDDAEKMAAAACKNGNNKAAFQLYHSELMSATNNVVYFKSEQTRFVNWTFCDPDYTFSNDKTLCDRAEVFMTNLMNQSNNISKESLRIRNQYFTALRELLNKERRKYT
ncbi:MAG: helix-turn-helix transcriptional regulator [Bacteroidota bacterium]